MPEFRYDQFTNDELDLLINAQNGNGWADVPDYLRQKIAAEEARANQPEPTMAGEFTGAIGEFLNTGVQRSLGRSIEATGEATGLSGLAGYGRGVAEEAIGRTKFRPSEPDLFAPFGEYSSGDIGLGEAIERTGEATAAGVGQGVATTVPVLAAGAAGFGIGSAVPFIGSAVGYAAGAASTSYVLNQADSYEQMIQEGVPAEFAARLSVPVGAIMAALDTIGAAGIWRSGLGKTPNRFLTRLITKAASAFASEGWTEATQSAVQQAAAAYATGNPDLYNRSKQIITEGLFGGLTGGLVGGTIGAFNQENPQQATDRRNKQRDDAIRQSIYDLGYRQQLAGQRGLSDLGIVEFGGDRLQPRTFRHATLEDAIRLASRDEYAVDREGTARPTTGATGAPVAGLLPAPGATTPEIVTGAPEPAERAADPLADFTTEELRQIAGGLEQEARRRSPKVDRAKVDRLVAMGMDRDAATKVLAPTSYEVEQARKTIREWLGNVRSRIEQRTKERVGREPTRAEPLAQVEPTPNDIGERAYESSVSKIEQGYESSLSKLKADTKDTRDINAKDLEARRIDIQGLRRDLDSSFDVPSAREGALQSLLNSLVLRGQIKSRSGNAEAAVANGQPVRPTPNDLIKSEEVTNRELKVPKDGTRRFAFRPVITEGRQIGGPQLWSYEIDGRKAPNAWTTRAEAVTNANEAVARSDAKQKPKPRIFRAGTRLGLVEQVFDRNGRPTSEAVRETYRVDAPDISRVSPSGSFQTIEEARNAAVPLVPGLETATVESAREGMQRVEDWQEKNKVLARGLNRVLSRLGLGDEVGLRLFNIMPYEGGFAEGATVTDDRGVIIRLALDVMSFPSQKEQFQYIAGVLNHEVIHALRRLGHFTDAQWNTLTEAARRRKSPDGGTFYEREVVRNQMSIDAQNALNKERGIEREVTGLTDAQIEEEAVANMFRDYALNPNKARAKTKTAGLFRRLVDFFRRIGEWLRNNNFKDAESVMRQIQSGEIARQEPQVGQRQASGVNLSANPIPINTDSREFKKWFKNGVLVDDDGNPLVLWHGSRRDIHEFSPKYPDGLMFFSLNKEFASKWPVGTDPHPGGLRYPGDDIAAQAKEAREYRKSLYEDEQVGLLLDMERDGRVTKDQFDRLLKLKLEAINDKFQKRYGTGFKTDLDIERWGSVQVYPVYLNVQNLFNPEKDYKKIEPFLRKHPRLKDVIEPGYHKRGNWLVYENEDVVNWMDEHGYDGMLISEDTTGPHETVAVWDNKKIKSIWNQGTWDSENPNISLSANPALVNTDSRKFKEWFGDSKATFRGKPLLMVHSSERGDIGEITEFDTDGFNAHFGSYEQAHNRALDRMRFRDPNGWMRRGQLASLLKAGVKEYATGINFMPVYLSIKKPFPMDDVGAWHDSIDVANGILSSNKKLKNKRNRRYVSEGTKPLDVGRVKRILKDARFESRFYTGVDFDASIDPLSMSVDASPWTESDENKEFLSDLKKVLEDSGYDGVIYENIGEGGGINTQNIAFIPFHKGQIKSAYNRGTWDQNEPNISLSSQPFYSPLLRAVENAKQERASPKDWKAIVSKLPGVKQIEVEWTGLTDWLDGRNERQVSKEAVVRFLQRNKINVVTSVMAGDEFNTLPEYHLSTGEPIYPEDDDFWLTEAESYKDAARDELDEDASEEEVTERAVEMAKENYEPTEFEASIEDTNFSHPVYHGTYDSDTYEYNFPDLANDWLYGEDALYFADSKAREKIDAENDRVAESIGAEFLGHAEWEGWTLPGGSNYREILIRVPDLHEIGPNALAETTKYPFRKPEHFDVDNVVVHTRVDDRVDKEGNKVLFVEEIQSDLSSMWRENEEETPEKQARRKELFERFREVNGKIRDNQDELLVAINPSATDAFPIDERGSAKQLINVNEGRLIFNNVTNIRNQRVPELRYDKRMPAGVSPETPAHREFAEKLLNDDDFYKSFKALERERTALFMERASIQDEITELGTDKSVGDDEPFTPFPQEYAYNLAVKRMLHIAANGGYGKLAWTPAYMQAERWTRGAQELLHEISWQRDNENTNIKFTMRNGRDIWLTVNPEGVIVAAPTMDSSAAERVVGKKLSALVGPSLAEEILAKELGHANPDRLVLQTSGYAIGYDQQTKRAVDKFAKKLDARVESDETLFGPERPVWSIRLTDKVREAAKQAQPMFSANPVYYRNDMFKKMADTQRGAPEQAMLRVQKLMPGGVLPFVAEHVGDITHRMGEWFEQLGGRENVPEKVTKALATLDNPYGFEREHRENVRNWWNARKESRDHSAGLLPADATLEDYEAEIDKRLKDYAEAHRQVPVYNDMQHAARSAAIAVGEKDWREASRQLHIIDDAMKDGTYPTKVSAFSPTYESPAKPGDYVIPPDRNMATDQNLGQPETQQVEPEETDEEIIRRIDPTQRRTDYSAVLSIPIPQEDESVAEVMLGPEEDRSLRAQARQKAGDWTSFIFGTIGDETWQHALKRNTVNRVTQGYDWDRAVLQKMGKKVADLAMLGPHSLGILMENALQFPGRMEFLVQSGQFTFDPKTNEIIPLEGTEAYKDIIEELGWRNVRHLQMVRIARRELKLRAEGRESFTEIPTQKLKDLMYRAERQPEIMKALYRLDRWNRNNIEFAFRAGLLSREGADHFAEMDYVPYYRVIEDEQRTNPDHVLGPTFAENINNPAGPFRKKLKGGDFKIGDMIENDMKNVQAILSASLKTVALKQAAQHIKTLDDPKQYGFDITGKEKIIDNTPYKMVFYDGGQKKVYAINDPVMWHSIAAMKPEQRSALQRFGAIASGLLRAGVTLFPGFQIANLWRGKTTGYAISNSPISLTETISGFLDALRNGVDTQTIKLNTGMGGYRYGQNPTNDAKVMTRMMRTNDPTRPPWKRAYDYTMAMIRFMEYIGEATEMAERVAIYRRFRKKGFGKLRASWEANNMINYHRLGAGGGAIGATTLYMIPMLPFLNARIQGLYRIFENQRGEKVYGIKGYGLPAGVAHRGAVVMAATLALYAWSREHPDWEDEAIHNKVNYDLIYLGKERNSRVIALPRGFEVGSFFGALPVLLLDQIDRKDNGRQLVDGLIHILTQTLAFSPMPQFIAPIAEVRANRDAFSGMPIEGAREQNLLPQDRISQYTSGLGIALGQVTGPSRTLREIGLDLSPEQWDHLIRGYLAGFGVMMMNGVDAIGAAADLIPEKPNGRFGDPQGVGMLWRALGLQRFYRDDTRSRQSRSEFYRMAQRSREVALTVKDSINTNEIEYAKELLRENAAPAALYRSFTKMSRELGKINSAIRYYSLSFDMSGEEKEKAIRRLRRRADDITRKMVAIGRRYGL